MKRCAIKLGLFLVLGAIINIAVAWGLYLWRPFEAHPFRSSTSSEAAQVWDRAWQPGTRFADDSNQRRYDPHGRFNATPAYRIIVVQHGRPDRSQMQWPDGYAWEFQAGWPARSIVGHKWAFDKSNHGLMVIKDTWIPIRKHGSPIFDDYLPYSPYWPGFAINTIFYAAILWLLFAVPFIIRRKWRIQGGLCPACAYPVGIGDVCTECGKPIPFRLRGRAHTKNTQCAPT